MAPITNGHAARMRYSRFRSTILGHEPNKRRGSSDDKSKITKSRKSSPSLRKEPAIKSESGASLSSYPHYSSASVSPYTESLGDDFDTRFLTPCSDDISQSLSLHPSALDYNIEPAFLKQEPGLDDADFSTFETAFSLFGNNPYDMESQNALDSSLIDTSNDWSQDYSDNKL